ncbi:hypothetical protein BDV28DRAFT_160117 [Aspergillus coremiiformis]|uniref:Protein kinase domain-containing protein n=1 Tax=Aspergillus coremiiformis TaxID=138285 RepID=A0A5N6YWR3_9EURO|nr:hypothetical protein BDV28DRAFT_160117 [Aspergillus coremiiformis]
MTTSLLITLDGEPLHDSETLGYGRTGVVISRDHSAVKLPLRHPWSSDSDVQSNMEVIEHEPSVYRRFFKSFPKDQVDGIVPCLGVRPNATQLTYMENGDLRAYLEKNQPSRAVQIQWFRQMARALEQIMINVFLSPILLRSTRNVLLDSDLSINIFDLSEESLLPLTNYTKFDFDLCNNGIPKDGRALWPLRNSLHRSDGLWLGPIIENSWAEGGFQNAHHVLEQDNRLWLNTRLPISSWPYPNHVKNSVVML